MRVYTRWVDLLAIYRAELLERVMPFWIDHAIDWEYGGISTCIADDGTIISQDKYLWSQLRAIWTFAALYNRIDRRPLWLDVARHIYQFVRRCGRDEAGRWVFAVDRHGRVIEGATSIFTDGFAIYGLTELARATGEQEAIDLALETYRRVRDRLAHPGSYGIAPYEMPTNAKAHAVAMIFALVFYELGRFLDDREIMEAGLAQARDVMDVFLRPDDGLVREYVALDGSLIDAPQGRVVVPGHAIESMWFMVHIFRREGDERRVLRAIEAIRRHLEFGWDAEYGGLFHARDAAGGQASWRFAEAKLWWPHTEALYALLLAYEVSRQAWCLEWFERVHDYAFSHFPVPRHGEWTQRLDREGRPLQDVVALPVKDPFHLPRSLILSIQLLERSAHALEAR